MHQTAGRKAIRQQNREKREKRERVAKRKDMFSSTLICCAYHRKNPPWEKCAAALEKRGFKRWCIIDSGKHGVGEGRHPCGDWGNYEGPCEIMLEIPYSSFSGSMTHLWKMDLPEGIERIVLIDNDNFIVDPEDMVEYVMAFIEGEYDITCLPSFRFPEISWNDTGDIIVEQDLSLVNTKLQPGAIAYSIFKKDFWLKTQPPIISADDWWMSLAKLGPKFGVRRTSKKMRMPMVGGHYSQWDEGRFLHLGNLITSYYQLDHHPFNRINQELILATCLRRGFFVKYFPHRIGGTEADKSRDLTAWEQFIGTTVGKGLL